ncbi:MAG TPA: hypothetical protein VK776_15740 [Bryobacteraceae bacterium]|nr:hypothetical protein [Bryobacteraceae bacterium]
MIRALGQRLTIPVLAVVFPAAIFADLNQTTTLSASNTTNLNFDTGAVSSSGGDIQFSSSGITPQGSAKAANVGLKSATDFATASQSIVQFWPGYSAATIPTATLDAVNVPLAWSDSFYVHTNGGHYAKVLVTASTSSSITLMFTTFGVSGGGTTGPPVITAIRNNSSGIAAGFPSYGIAPSSIFVVTGTGLADAGTPTLQSSAAPGLPLTLNGASISATVNGVTVHPAIYYTSPTQIAAVLPSSTPVGTGTLTVTYNGVASNAATLQVVPAALGINTFYTNSAVATDAVSGALLTYTNSGTPGEVITLWTTGLGADPADSDTTYTPTPHAVATPLQVYVGGTPASILYQGSAGFPGVDQINIIIPASISNGCWISLAAVSGGVLGNIATIPVNGVGGACVDAVNGLTGNQLTSTGSQALRTGLVAIQANTTGNKPVSNVAGGTFVAYSGLYSPNQPVSPGGCIVDYLQPATIGSITGLDPGTLTLTGPNGLSLTVPPSPLGLGMFASTLSATAIPDTGGTFTFTGSGGPDVGPFTSVLTFSNPLLSWTNPGIAATIDRSQNLTATWTGGNPGSYVYVTGVSTSKATSTAPSVSLGFTCLISASDGQVTVPSYILSALPPGSGGMGMQNDIYMPLTASGIDIGVALGEIGFSATATFR